MKKIKIFLAGIIFLVLCLSACAKEEVSDKKDNTTTVKEKKSTKKKNSKENAEKGDKSEEGGVVENNGGYFIGSGNKVYFRNYEDGLFEETALWGTFIDISEKQIASKICSYNIDTKEVESEFEDKGYGKLYMYDDTLYLQEYSEDSYSNIYSIKTDGSDRKDITHGNIIAMNSSNGVYAVEAYEAGKWLIELWQQDNLIYGIEDSENENVASFISVGQTDDHVLFIKDKYDQSGNPEIWALKLDNNSKLTKVGEFDVSDKRNQDSYPVISQIAYKDDIVYLGFSFYEGNAAEVTKGYVLKADLSKEDSIELVDDDMIGDNDEGILNIWVDKSGELKKGVHKPLSTWQEGTDLMFCDEEGNEKTLCTGVFPSYFGGSEFENFVEAAEYVKGSFFVMSCGGRRFKSEDIGWRMAYKCFSSKYLSVPAKENGEETVMASFVTEKPIEARMYPVEDAQGNIIGITYLEKLIVPYDDEENKEKYNLQDDEFDNDFVEVSISNYAYTIPVSKDLAFEYIDWNSGKVWSDSIKNTDYNGFIEYTKDEVLGQPKVREYEEYLYAGEGEEGEFFEDSLFADIWLNENGEAVKIEESYMQ